MRGKLLAIAASDPELQAYVENFYEREQWAHVVNAIFLLLFLGSVFYFGILPHVLQTIHVPW